MKHLKQQKKRKTLTKGKIVALGVALLVVAFGATLGIMLLLRGNLGYKEALGDANEILKTKVEVSAFLNGEAESLELDDEASHRVEEFEKAGEKVAQYMESLGASAALKNQAVAEKYESAKEAYGKLEKTMNIERTVMKLVKAEDGVSAEDLAELEKSDNKFLQEMAKRLSEYRALAEDFSKKYGDVENVDEKKLIEDYGNFEIAGEELTDAYAELSFKDIFDFDKDEVLSFYDRIEELIAVLNEKA